MQRQKSEWESLWLIITLLKYPRLAIPQKILIIRPLYGWNDELWLCQGVFQTKLVRPYTGVHLNLLQKHNPLRSVQMFDNDYLSLNELCSTFQSYWTQTRIIVIKGLVRFAEDVLFPAVRCHCSNCFRGVRGRYGVVFGGRGVVFGGRGSPIMFDSEWFTTGLSDILCITACTLQ